MDRINTATKAVDLHGAGKHGFTGGNPNGSVPATKLSPAWCNAVQEALVRVIEEVGLTPDDADYDQFVQALYLAARDWRPGPTSESGAPRTWVTQEGSYFESWLAGERTIADVNRVGGTTANLDFAVLNNGGFGGEVEAIIMRTDLPGRCGRLKYGFQGVRQAGTVTIGGGDILYENFDTLVIDSHSLIASGGSARLRIIPSDNTKKYNIQTVWRVLHVDTYLL